MRIAIVVPGFSAHADDWAIPALQTLFSRLATHHDIQLFSLRYPAAGVYRFAGLTHRAMGGGERHGVSALPAWMRLVQAIRQQHQQQPFDLLHAFWADEPGFLAALAARLMGRPLIVSLGGWELSHLPQIGYGAQRLRTRRWMIGLALRQAQVILANSAYQHDQCRAHGLPATKVRFLPWAVDATRFQPPASRAWPPDPPTLVQAASLIPVKHQRLLLEVLRLSQRHLPTLRLTLAGSGPLQAELMALAQQYGLADHIGWPAQVAYPAMPRLYQQSHLYVQSSWHESQGMAVLEAMACGLPVIGTPVGVVREVACQPASFEAETLAEQVVRLFADEGRYRACSQQARQTVVEMFGLDTIVTQLAALYRAEGC